MVSGMLEAFLRSLAEVRIPRTFKPPSMKQELRDLTYYKGLNNYQYYCVGSLL